MTEFLTIADTGCSSRVVRTGRQFWQGLERAPQTLALAVGAVMCLSGCDVRGIEQSQLKSRDAAVKSNMRTAQIAVESYAMDHNGNYPTDIDVSFKSYFPGGSSGTSHASSLTPGNPSINPFTNKPEWPVIGHVTDLQATRDDASASLEKGVIEYSPIGTPPTSYAIRGGGGEDKVITVPKSHPPIAMVLSNK